VNEQHVLCLLCRSAFSDAEIEGASGCPRCGNTGVPADTNETGEVKLTKHEWRILCMWADNWGAKCDRGTKDRGEPDRQSGAVVRGIIREIQRQAPHLGALTFGEELQEVANTFGKVEHHHDGAVDVITPETKQ
jgi:predicted  nucleic acid-binding Zn-ribbon protein